MRTRRSDGFGFGWVPSVMRGFLRALEADFSGLRYRQRRLLSLEALEGRVLPS